MKTCSECKKKKHIKSFRKRKRSNDGLSSRCKDCQREYDKQWYKNNPNRKKYIRKKNSNQRDVNRAFVLSYLKKHPCIDCGESDPVVLDFDHIENKKLDVSVMTISSYSTERIKEEISKCEVRCANCHRRKTSEMFNYYRSR